MCRRSASSRRPEGSPGAYLHAPRLTWLGVQQAFDPLPVVVAFRDHRSALPEGVLQRAADRVQRRAAALAHALRAVGREGRRALEVARLDVRDVERGDGVVVVEGGLLQLAVLVVLERLPQRGADS